MVKGVDDDDDDDDDDAMYCPCIALALTNLQFMAQGDP